jgi:hypothetical protein
MAVATWLKRSETAQFDLDALLAVELPAVSTPRYLERLLSTEYFAVPPSGEVTIAAIKERSGAMGINPVLQRTVGDFFRDQKTFTAWICRQRAAERRPCSSYAAEAATLFAEQRDLPLRSLLRSEKDLLALLELLVNKLVYPLPPEGEAVRAAQVADGKRLEEIRGGLERVRGELAAAGEPVPEAVAAERDRLEAEFAAIMKRYHDGGKAAAAWQTRSRIQVNGGISLRPGEFTIRKGAESKALKEFKRKAQSAAVGAGEGGAGVRGRLVRSRPSGKVVPVAARGGTSAPAAAGKAAVTPPAKVQAPPPAAAAKPATSPKPSAPAAAARTGPQGKGAEAPRVTAAPSPAAAPAPVEAAAPRTPALVAARIAVPAGAAGAARAVGELAADGRIVFKKAP